jgi:hypothetical protein
MIMPLACIMSLESKITIEIEIKKPCFNENNNIKQVDNGQANNPFECTKGRGKKNVQEPKRSITS